MPGFAYTVQAGDTLERLARFYLGSESFASAILIATNETSDFSSDVRFIQDPYVLQTGARVWIPDESAAKELRSEDDSYEQSVYAASLLRSQHRDLPLLAIPPGTAAVQAVTWARASTTYSLSKTVPFSLTARRDIWVTIAPALQEFCRKLQLKDLALRLEQRLGLPPGSGDALFVQFRVPLASVGKNFFRPCLDPRITTTECPVGGSPSQSPSWYPAWFYQQYFESYGDTPYHYPWTALGYTYDWSKSPTHFGESEFVIRAGATIQVESITPTAQYCAASS